MSRGYHKGHLDLTFRYLGRFWVTPSQAGGSVPPDIPGMLQRVEKKGETKGDSELSSLQMTSLPHEEVRSPDYGFS